MVDFSPYNSHRIVYFIIWKMHGFPHRSPKAQENVTKLIEGENLGNWCSYVSHITDAFFSIRLRFYGIHHHKGNACVLSVISHNMGKDSLTHRMGKDWEIESRKYPTKPTVCGEPGKLVFILFPQYGCFFPLDSHSVVYFKICEIHGFPHQFPVAWENAVTSIELGEPRKLVPIFYLTHGYFSSIRFIWYTLLPHGKYMVFPIKIHSVTSLVFPQYYFFYLLQNLLIP